MSVRIAPSILAADFGRLAEEVREAQAAGADWIHVDVMDGHFVPNLTMGPRVTAAVREATDLTVDVHLMIERPERFVDAFVAAGADRITVHQETCPHLHRALQQIREAGALPGVAINPSTPVDLLEDVAADLELLLIMSVNPGFGGQTYIPASTDKLRRARALLDRRGRPEAELQVDGGVDADSTPAIVEAGATVLVAGSAIFRHPGGIRAGLSAIRGASGAVQDRRTP